MTGQCPKCNYHLYDSCFKCGGPLIWEEIEDFNELFGYSKSKIIFCRDFPEHSLDGPYLSKIKKMGGQYETLP